MKKGYVSSFTTENIAALALSTSTDLHKVYVVANLGDVTGNILADATGATGIRLSDFKALAYSLDNDANVGTTGLPMIGSTDMVPATTYASITLKRLVARINVTCNVSIPTGESFVCNTMQLKNVPKKGRYVSASSYPDNAVSSNFFNDNALSTNSGTWYIPENRRGTVNNTDAALKNSLAPNKSTYVDISGIYTLAGVPKEVTYRVYLGGNATNDFEILGNTLYNVSITIKSYNEADARIMLTTDLSRNAGGQLETANSYIASQGGKYYKFNAAIMGNGKTTPSSTVTGGNPAVTQNAPAITPVLMDPANAIVVWETGSKGSVIEEGSVALGTDNYVRFQTANNTTNGNAVIAVRDASNNILWSWHIWKVPYNPNSDYDAYKTFWGRSFNMMKYNLGATVISPWNGTATNAGDLGLLYQWGRKDPFLGSSGWAGSAFVQATYTSPYSFAITTNTTLPSGAGPTIQYSISNPTNLIVGTLPINDWLNEASYAGQRNNLWGNPLQITALPFLNRANDPNLPIGTKSIYDPCPPGWRVPPMDAFTNFGDNSYAIVNVSTSLNVLNSNMGINKGYDFYFTSYKQGPTTYYPACGYLSSSSGSISEVSGTGTYWNSASYVSG
ncbi:MAG: DUF4906 domain-containing protein, partial [Erysipelotrichales bacterium]|nr:DUF4906 domain-containing protein [Erysipelotrichales bacterium]